jgi:CHAD domain-containing protein
MAHELHRSGDLPRELHRILLEQIRNAQSALSPGRLSDDAIHKGRKSIKKARATLRLLRASIPEHIYRKENRALRDIARPLGKVRDAGAMLETLDRLARLYGPAVTRSIPAELRNTLKRDRTRATGHLQRSGRRAAPAPARDLGTVSRRVSRAVPSKDGWDAVGPGLKRIYRAGRHAMKLAKRTHSTQCLHEWRKQTKYLRHQIQILQPLWPGMIGEFSDQAHKLSDYLGDDHDLVVLRGKVCELRAGLSDARGAAALLALIDRCREHLQEKSFLTGGRIYEDSPADFGKQYARYWRRWRKEKNRG